MTQARIEQASSVGASLAGSRLVDVVIHGFALSGADLDHAVLSRVDVRNSKLAGVQFAHLRWHDVRRAATVPHASTATPADTDHRNNCRRQ